ncbi:terpenoid cyclases/Protein prenyltransferase [Bimuria novae-zelandiae CBS 107.79]|uniref:Terpenoid cyclases/Protein prenyltransferase n=1 Tax=Bimuria novae-zelandiae CBS 107.79 TaxID=1447943 RepID=A0A6A5V3U1_9PLEO|nr:terpenoid cyclases/Protein prenyltransferase [Bimuria novae-zelandiae CBS 107.79]
MEEKASLAWLEQAVRESASHAAAYAHATMRSSGHWLCGLRSTVSFTAQYTVLRTILPNNPLSEEEKIKMRRWIESQQDCNGCWGLLPKDMGEEHLSTIAEAYLALKLPRVAPEKTHMQAARRLILESGGLSKVGVTTQLRLALLGLVAWSELPRVPPELMLLTYSGPFFNIYSLAYWARTAAIPIIILRHHQPVYRGIVPLDFLGELWVDPHSREMTYTPSIWQLWKEKD